VQAHSRSGSVLGLKKCATVSRIYSWSSFKKNLEKILFQSIPIHSDIVDYQPRKNKADVYFVSFPCTGTSRAGKKTGLAHIESNLWFEASGASSSVDQVLWLWSSLLGLSIEGYEQLLPDSEWQDLRQRLRLSARRSAVRHTRGKEFLSLPTPTPYLSSGKGGRAGQNKLESTLKSQGRLSATQKLNPELCLWIMGFQTTWLECITKTGGELQSTTTKPWSRTSNAGKGRSRESSW
jgi:hypothetical protein